MRRVPQKPWDRGERPPAVGIRTEGWLHHPLSTGDEVPRKSVFLGVQSREKVSLKLQKSLC